MSEHGVNYIGLAVPFFFLLIAGEIAWARVKGRRVYRFADALTDLSCGATSQMALVFSSATLLALYATAYDRFRVVTFARDQRWLVWLVAFVGVDFLYYWWHRLSHEVNVLWAAHVVHHSSEDYNLAVALRQAVLTSWTSLPFYLPLAFVGVPTLVFAAAHSFSTLYQFWIHTELVGKKRGPVDWVLNLPSHHRVHHAINPAYLDKNYGATLIVWDRLFGTFAEEIEPPVYGITKPLASFHPLWAQVHYWVELARASRAAHGFHRVRVWFASPASMAACAPRPADYVKYDRAIDGGAALRIGLVYAVVIAAGVLLILFQAHLGLPARIAVAGAVVGALVLVGLRLERVAPS